jgi:two-component system sensor histidine kinase UhpB
VGVGNYKEKTMALMTAPEDITTIDGVITDPRPLDFHTAGLAGCIDRLTVPLRSSGTVVRLHTPHHGVEIDAGSAVLLYRAAQELLSSVLNRGAACQVDLRLTAVYHGIRLAVTDDGDPAGAGAAAQDSDRLDALRRAVEGTGGRLTVSGDSAGRCVTVTLPLD